MPFKPIIQSFSIQHEYKLYFTEGVFDTKNSLFREVVAAYKPAESVKLLFVIDEGLPGHHPSLLPSIRKYCAYHKENLCFTDALVVPGGERVKNDYSEVTRVLEAINAHHICRHSFVVIIGGGAVIDMAGYAAAIAHRGVKLIRIPTTVLSQNDAAVGVKNGINLFKKKNFVGTFAPPFAIINDSRFLSSLEQRDWIAGVAEAVKVALIRDEAFFHYLREHSAALKSRDMAIMQHVIHRCAEIHMEHIARGGDPFESGSSRPLDFGHWAAHKLEQMTAYRLRHGEAVAKGIALDVTYARLMGMISEDIMLQVIELFENLGFNLCLPLQREKELDELLCGIEEFREHLGGRLTVTLISGIGKKSDVHHIDLATMKKALQVLNAACQKKLV